MRRFFKFTVCFMTALMVFAGVLPCGTLEVSAATLAADSESTFDSQVVSDAYSQNSVYSETLQLSTKGRHKVVLSKLGGAKDSSVSVSAYFDEDFFKKENNMDTAKSGLLKLSALGALSTYSRGSERDTVWFLESCGFKDIVKMFSKPGAPQGKSTEQDNDHGTVYCGWMDLSSGKRLFAFIVSGYSSGHYEWISNFNVGTESLHEGFDLASQELAVITSNYMSAHLGGKSAKVWIMGHSRGAALTNLLAIHLVKGDVKPANASENVFKKSVKLSASDVFAYGFATPQYTTKKIAGFESTILNFVSPHDFVPGVAPSAWGFKRAGTNYTFSKFKKMKTKYKALTGHDYRGYTKKEKNALLKEFASFGKSQREYSGGYFVKVQNGGKEEMKVVMPKDYGMYGIGLAMSEDRINSFRGLTNMMSETAAGALTMKLGIDATTSKIGDSHEMLAYLAWIEAEFK